MSPTLRKAALAVHIAVSVGWLGAVGAYLALDVAAVTGHQAATLRTAYLGMELIARNVIVPLAFASLVTGLVVALGTTWGLLRHYWVVLSFLLTVLAAVVLLAELRTIGSLAEAAADPRTSGDDLRALGGTLVHSVGGALVLLVILGLNVYKPRGLTRYGWRKQHDEDGSDHRSSSAAPSSVPGDGASSETASSSP